VRVLLLCVVALSASPAGATSFDDLLGSMTSANDRNAAKRPLEGSPTQFPGAPAREVAGPQVSFLDDPLPDPAEAQSRPPQVPGPGIPLDLGVTPAPIELGSGDPRVSAPVPEPTAALLFSAGAGLVAWRFRTQRYSRV